MAGATEKEQPSLAPVPLDWIKTTAPMNFWTLYCPWIIKPPVQYVALHKKN